MQISIIYGNDVVAGRNALRKITDKYEAMSVVRGSGSEVTENFLVNNLRGGDLFSEKKLVVLENPALDLEWSRLGDGEVELVVLFDKELPVTSSIFKEPFFKKARMMHFEIAPDQSIFEWLDLLADKNPRAFEMQEELQGKFGEQYLMTMVFYLLRRQVLPSESKSSSVRAKLERQKRNFPVGRVEELYRAVIESDFQLKSGVLDGKSAMFLLVERFMK